MTKGTFYFIALCFFVMSCQAQESPQKNLSVDIKDDLKNYLLVQYDDIKISEIYTKNNNKKDYLEKSLGNGLLKEAAAFKAQDIFFKPLSASTESHLGVVYFYYETPDKAKNSMANIEKKGFFANTKILTKYVAVNSGSTNLVVYTESSADKIALGFLDSVANKIPVGPDKK